jgi:hypothetical protein
MNLSSPEAKFKFLPDFAKEAKSKSRRLPSEAISVWKDRKENKTEHVREDRPHPYSYAMAKNDNQQK